MNFPQKLTLWLFTCLLGTAFYFYISSTLYFMLQGWDAGRVLPWSIIAYFPYTTLPHGLYLSIALTLPLLTLCAIFALWQFRPRKTQIHWATQRDIAKAGLLASTGVILGKLGSRYLMSDDPAHIFVVAQAHSGKGVSMVIPNLLNWSDSFICLDVKGENHRITSGYRASLGHKIINFAPLARDGNSHCYNPLEQTSKHPQTRITDLYTIASSLIPIEEHGDHHFPSEAQDFFVGIALYVIDNPAMPTTIGAIFRMLGTDDTIEDVLRHILQTHSGLNENARQLFNSFIQKADKERSAIKSTLASALKLWHNPIIDAATSHSDFQISELRSKRHAIYLNVAVSDITPLRPLMQLFCDQVISHLTSHTPCKDKEPYQVLVMLDEMHILGRLRVMSDAFPLLADYNVRLMGVVQNLSMLDNLYGRSKRDTILANCAHQVFYASSDPTTQHYISHACGIALEKQAPKTHTPPPLLDDSEIHTLEQNTQIILTSNHLPTKCIKVTYYKDAALKKRLLPAHETPKLTVKQKTGHKFAIQSTPLRRTKNQTSIQGNQHMIEIP